MIDIKKLNETYNKNWGSEEEIDWVWIAKNMEPDLKFMKENAINLLPDFVCENPGFINEDGSFTDIYMDWIEWVNGNIIYPEQSEEIIDWINNKLQSDPDFESEIFEHYDGSVGFYGMDQGTLYNEKVYIHYTDTVISKETPWEESRSILLELMGRGKSSAEHWDLLEDMATRLEDENLSRNELLGRLKEHRELTKEDLELSEYGLCHTIAEEMLLKQE